jgi:hypothetical protein
LSRIGLFPLSLLVLLTAPSGLSGATPPAPSYGIAVVDGAYAEWNLGADFFADMHEAGNPTHPLKSKAYLRYDCRTNTLYVLVLMQPGVIGYHNSTNPSATSWVAIDSHNRKRVNENSGNDGVPPDFAWVDLAYDGDPNHDNGYEASFILTPGNYVIIIHTAFWNGTAGGTSATIGAPSSGPALVIDCTLLGACCTPDGTCSLAPMASCPAPSGWHGEWTICTPNPCPVPPPPVGACCFIDGACELLTEEQCLVAPEHLAWLGATATCTPDNPCPQPTPTGACCGANGNCAVTSQADCRPPSMWHPEWTSCVPNPCPAPVPTRSTTWGRIKADFR